MIPDLFAWTTAALVAHERLDTLPRRRFSLLADLDEPKKVARPASLCLCKGCGATHPSLFDGRRISRCMKCRNAQISEQIMAKRRAMLTQVKGLRK